MNAIGIHKLDGMPVQIPSAATRNLATSSNRPASAARFEDELQDRLAAPSADEIEGPARQFEALMIGQALQSVSWGESMDEESEMGGSTALDFAKTFLAQAIADGGGLGLTDMVLAGLRAEQAKTNGSER